MKPAPTSKLMTQPGNSQTRRLFVAGTRMNEGKTTTSLGLFSALQSRYHRVGFIKPVGQRFLEIDGQKIDEDSFLFDSVYKVATPINAMSPVAVDGNFTRRFLDDPEGTLPGLINDICQAFDRAAWEKDFIIIEGTGHAGVGAVFDLSNAQVARLLGAKHVVSGQSDNAISGASDRSAQGPFKRYRRRNHRTPSSLQRGCAERYRTQVRRADCK